MTFGPLFTILFVITEKDIPIDDELYIMSDCPPAYDEEFYIPADIIVSSAEKYDRFKDEFGMVQKAVEREGVDLSGLLRVCAADIDDLKNKYKK